MVLVVDADTTLASRFTETALREIEKGAGACGGVFYGEQGGGLLGVFPAGRGTTDIRGPCAGTAGGPGC